jgi:hypothetical protein
MRVKIWTDIYGVTRKTPIPESYPHVAGEITMDSVTAQEWKGVPSGEGGTNTLRLLNAIGEGVSVWGQEERKDEVQPDGEQTKEAKEGTNT